MCSAIQTHNYRKYEAKCTSKILLEGGRNLLLAELCVVWEYRHMLTIGVCSWTCRFSKKYATVPLLQAVKKATLISVHALSYASCMLRGACGRRITSKLRRRSVSGSSEMPPGRASILTKGFISLRVAALASATLHRVYFLLTHGTTSGIKVGHDLAALVLKKGPSPAV